MYLGFCWRDISENSFFSIHKFPLKPAKFGCDLSVIFSTLPEEKYTFLSDSRKWIFLKLHTCRPTHITYMLYVLVMIEQNLRSLYWQNIWLYLNLHCRELPENWCVVQNEYSEYFQKQNLQVGL